MTSVERERNVDNYRDEDSDDVLYSPSYSTTPNIFDFPRPPRQTSESKSKSEVSREIVDTEILCLLSFGAKSGYELRKHLLRMFEIDISYGTLYPHLHSLEKAGLVSGTWSSKEEDVSSTTDSSPRKKIYVLTESGASLLKESIENLGRLGITMQFLYNKVDLGHSSAFVKSNERESTIRAIQALLARRSYSVTRDAILKGISGKDYHVEVLGSRSLERNRKETLLVDIVDQLKGPPMGLDHAMKVLVVAQDVDAKLLVLAVPRLAVEVTDFLTFHRAIVFDGGTWQSVLSDFLLRFGRSLE